MIYWPHKKYTFCTSEGGVNVLILRRPFVFQGPAAVLILGQLGFLTYIPQEAPGMVPSGHTVILMQHFAVIAGNPVMQQCCA